MGIDGRDVDGTRYRWNEAEGYYRLRTLHLVISLKGCALYMLKNFPCKSGIHNRHDDLVANVIGAQKRVP